MKPMFSSIVLFLAVVLSGCEVKVGSQDYPAVCELRTGGSGGSGTLIAVNENYALILTCRHVASKEGDDAVMTWWADGKEQTTFGRVMLVSEGGDYRNDQALIIGQVPKGIKPLPVGKFNPNNGPLVCVGWRGGKLYESISKRGEYDENLEGVIVVDQPLIGGMSGGPCLQNGVVVGVGVGSNRINNGYISNGKALEKLLKIVSE